MREYTDKMAHLDSQVIYFLSAAACVFLIIFNDCGKAAIAFAIVLVPALFIYSYYYHKKGSRKVQHTSNPDPNKFYDESSIIVGARVAAMVVFVSSMYLLARDGDDSRLIAVIVLAIDVVFSVITYLAIRKKILSRTSPDDVQ